MDDRRVIRRKRDLAGHPAGRRAPHELVQQRRVEEEAVAIDQERFGVPRDLVDRVHDDLAGAMAREHIALVEPERLVQDPQIPRHFHKGDDAAPIPWYDLLHGLGPEF